LAPDLLAVFNSKEQHLASLNNSFIVLIPKKPGASLPKDFRPISLLNGVQNFFSKTLAMRLQPKMDQLVDMVQTSFIKGRQIKEGYTYA
jgi:hypothetical protein